MYDYIYPKLLPTIIKKSKRSNTAHYCDVGNFHGGFNFAYFVDRQNVSKRNHRERF